VAEAIATELDVAAENVKTKDKLAEDSFVFLGAGLYGPLRAPVAMAKSPLVATKKSPPLDRS
jgi:hypothetical protein